jgi:hypothetical protein
MKKLPLSATAGLCGAIAGLAARGAIATGKGVAHFWAEEKGNIWQTCKAGWNAGRHGRAKKPTEADFLEELTDKEGDTNV